MYGIRISWWDLTVGNLEQPNCIYWNEKALKLHVVTRNPCTYLLAGLPFLFDDVRCRLELLAPEALKANLESHKYLCFGCEWADWTDTTLLTLPCTNSTTDSAGNQVLTDLTSWCRNNYDRYRATCCRLVLTLGYMANLSKCFVDLAEVVWLIRRKLT